MPHQNIHEHLLTVAQKIIKNSAPIDIITKYYKLKESMLLKRNQQTLCYRNSSHSKLHKQSSEYQTDSYHSNTNTHTHTQKKKLVEDLLAIKLMDSNNGLTNKKKTCKNSHAKESRKNSRSISSAAPNKHSQSSNTVHSYPILNIYNLNIGEVMTEIKTKIQSLVRKLHKHIKCSQSNDSTPTLLKMHQQNHNLTHNAILSTINQTIQQIHSNISQLSYNLKIAQIQPQNDNKSIKYSELQSDNKWLIQKMQEFIQENQVLRKMIKASKHNKTCN